MKGLDEFQARLGYVFRGPALLMQALTHASYGYEADLADNQRLEFLGDAVIDLAASHYLLATCPDASEGELSRRRAAMVNESALAAIALRLQIGDVLRLGKGERRSGASTRPSILADTVEAVLGAVFLDGGYEAAERLARTWFLNELGESYAKGDPKSRLQEWAQKRFNLLPVYAIDAESGPPHERRYRVSVRVRDELLGEGEGRSKKEAELNAARAALEKVPDA